MAKSFLGQIRRSLYLAQRTAGDIEAAERGPGPFAKRIARRHVTRRIGRTYNKLWRW